ncbi:alpha-amylase family glycosyl hydrolase [Novosphingobium gossypii]|uniref:alpha-amylase family glycosyl hydrolase n=1 Tax=Novosphingobium gossypii TaxID=1604774 RepID=UPI003D20A638
MTNDTPNTAPWWRGAAIYQIYPRSFADSNGDGIGDLPGITARLDHVARLGVEAIWISPFYQSPMADFGYDISDYCAVDPMFGTLEDFDALVVRARELGLKIIVDQVYAHTSDRHPWFAQSRSSRDNPHADWYVWADPKQDGTPPNNWQSIFGGPAWRWDARRRQYYMHNFLAEQPQLNCHNPAVQDALLGVAKFWLDRGVSGFRIDALNHSMFDPDLRDNPAAPDTGQPRTRPYDFQTQLHNQSHPDILPFIERLQALIASYPDTYSLCEVGGARAGQEMKTFTHGPDRLDSAYGFDFLYADNLTPQRIAAAQDYWPDEPDTGWPSWAFENHDAPRALSRWCAPDQIDAFARMKTMLLLSLRGNPILFQGEELGLLQDEIPFEMLRDPEAIANWPLTLSRDGVRTPLPWIAQSEHGGFTADRPWLPLSEQNLSRAVDRQEADPASLLNLTRHLLHRRAGDAALRRGSCDVLVADDARLVLRREIAGRRVLTVFNMSAQAAAWPAAIPTGGTVIAAVNDTEIGSLPAWGGIWIIEGEEA